MRTKRQFVHSMTQLDAFNARIQCTFFVRFQANQSISNDFFSLISKTLFIYFFFLHLITYLQLSRIEFEHHKKITGTHQMKNVFRCV